MMPPMGMPPGLSNKITFIKKILIFISFLGMPPFPPGMPPMMPRGPPI